jgi:hypothetical protein
MLVKVIACNVELHLRIVHFPIYQLLKEWQQLKVFSSNQPQTIFPGFHYQIVPHW